MTGAVTVPSVGWRLVPEEPTEAMVAASRRALKAHIHSVPVAEREARWGKPYTSHGYRVSWQEKAIARYRAMVAAAPSSPTPADTAAEQGLEHTAQMVWDACFAHFLPYPITHTMGWPEAARTAAEHKASDKAESIIALRVDAARSIAGRLVPSAAEQGLAEDLRRLSEAAPAGLLLERPERYDDWGWLRTSVPDADGFRPVVINTSTNLDDEDERAAARREDRQPRWTGAISAYLVALWNGHRTGRLVLAPPPGQPDPAERERIVDLYNRWLNQPGNEASKQYGAHPFHAFETGFAEGVATLAPSPAPDRGRECVRHVKRGTEYEVLGEAEGQVASGDYQVWPKGTKPNSGAEPLPARLAFDGAMIAVYREPSGKLWWCFTDEFRDGRFVTLDPPRSHKAAAGIGTGDLGGERGAMSARSFTDWWDGGDGPRDLLWRIRHRPWLPYPLRAVRISLDLHPFGFWLKPHWHYRKALSEHARQQGETIWWARWAWFQISYSRWM